MLYPVPDLPPHCEPATPLLVLISQIFGTCIPSYLSLLSTTAGLCSIVSWMFAQMPQIWKNYRRGSVEGLSLGFLSIWLGGDICNLLGAVWTQQMWFQQVVGAYYVSVDCVLVLQFFYFTVLSPPPILISYDSSVDDDSVEDSTYLTDSSTEEPKRAIKSERRAAAHRGGGRSLSSMLIVTVSLLLHLAGASPAVAVPTPAPRDPRTLTLQGRLGSVLSWVSTLLYLTSRLPQLLLNFHRRSTSGLAISLFVAAFFGNFFYSFSLLLNPLGYYDLPPYGGGGVAGPGGNDHLEWWGRTLPFFLGASGVLGLDAAVGWQWVLWGEREVAMMEPGGTGVGGEEAEAECLGTGGSVWRKWWPRNGGWSEDGEEGERKRLVGNESGRRASASSGSRYGIVE